MEGSLSDDQPTSRDPALTVPDRPGATRRERPSELAPRYAPGEEIARGGMGRVALATDTLLERTVAVKQALALDPELLRRFARETKITARLEHPSIVPVYDAGVADGVPFYVMRRVSGRPLSELIAAAGSFDARVALVPNVLAAAQAIAHAHARGIVHRDIKPGNILVGSFGETVVIDWGLAKVVEPDADADADDADDDRAAPLDPTAGDSLRTRIGAVIGTPGFMSPGQLRGEPAGYAADVYALGASLYFVLAGAPPHHAQTGEAMMVLAAQGPPAPLASVVPNVPRELVAIVETALGYGERRYANASAFVEDLRRFSTGQLVAAHHYSSRERLVRFVRRHRAAVAIGTVALAVIAVGATLAFRSIVAERDRADAQATEAVTARIAERERGDQLLLTRARMLVGTNPTEAVALLKDLAPASPRHAEAHGLASSAIMAGVAWGLKPPIGPTSQVELDASGNRLLQVMTGGELYLWDLVSRQELRHVTFPRAMRASWLGARVLVYGKATPSILDPATGTITPIALPALESVFASDDGLEYLGVEAESGEALRFDRDGVPRGRPWPGHRVGWAAITGNGRWIALADQTSFVVFDRDGTQVATRSCACAVIEASQLGRFAFQDRGEVWELVLAGTPAFRKIDTTRFHQYVASFGYRGEVLQIAMATGHLLAAYDDRLVELSRLTNGLSFQAAGGDREFVWMHGQRELLFFHPWGRQTIPLPQPLTYVRLAFRRGVERLVVVSTEVNLIYDLAALRPIELPLPRQAQVTVYDEDTLLLIDNDLRATTTWFDLATRTLTRVALVEPGLARHIAISRQRRVVQHVWVGGSSKLYELTKSSPDSRLLYDGSPVTAYAVLDDGEVVIGRGNELAHLSEPVRPLATLAHPIREVIPRDAGFVAVSVEGELVRGGLAGVFERVQLPALEGLERLAPSGGRLRPELATSPAGEIAVAWGDKVWRWAGQLELLGATGAPITDLSYVGDELLVVMPNRHSLVLAPATRRLRELSNGTEHIVSAGGNTLAIEIEGVYHVVDLATLTTWPTTVKHRDQVVITESGRRLIGVSSQDLLMWTLPRDSGPLRPRLDAATNATMTREGLLTWPWLAR